MVLVITIDQVKQDFINACGGPSAPIGNNGATASDLAEVLDRQIEHLVNPGSRVYDRKWNREQFWSQLINAVK